MRAWPSAKSLSRCCAASVVLFAAAFCARDAHALEAGAAKADITPQIGTPLNGYGDRMARGSTSVHDPLWARALYLDDGTTKVLLVNTDLCMINRELRDRVLELAPTEVPRENIILTATHTHNAQGAMYRHLPLRFVAGHFSQQVLDQTAEGIVNAMREAITKKERAAIGWGTAKQENLSVNRREDGGAIDSQIGVIRVDDADGNPIAIAANFAAHPTSVPDDLRLAISADYCGYYYNELEALTSEGCVAMFLNGAEGNQTLANPENQSGMARTESIGKLLATRVKGAANDIDCGEATLRVATATPTLPPTLAKDWLPESVFLQTLEINDLLLCFIPGEAVVEIGLELRRRAVNKGYAAQFSVGLANDYLLYFIPQKFYHQSTYEAAQNYYGPRVAEWFYREFSRLMSRGEPEQDIPSYDAAPAEMLGTARHIVLSGNAYERGFRRGALLKDELVSKFETDIVAQVESGAWLPSSGIWGFYPSFLDPSPVALPMMSIALRTMLNGLSDDAFQTMEGIAAGAGLPFDAVWLTQHANMAARAEDRSAFFRSPLCTMFALGPARSSTGQPLIGRNLDWDAPEEPVVTEVRPERGRTWYNIGFPWNEGVFSGMNDAGIVVCLETVKGLGQPGIENAPIEFVLRDLLVSEDKFEDALAILRQQSHVRGYHALIAGPSEDGYGAAVVEFADQLTVRVMDESGVLLGIDPASFRAPEEDRARYSRAAQLMGDAPLGQQQIERILHDSDPAAAPATRIFSERTRHALIFEPTRRRVHVSFPTEGGAAGAFMPLTLARGSAAEADPEAVAAPVPLAESEPADE